MQVLAVQDINLDHLDKAIIKEEQLTKMDRAKVGRSGEESRGERYPLYKAVNQKTLPNLTEQELEMYPCH